MMISTAALKPEASELWCKQTAGIFEYMMQEKGFINTRNLQDGVYMAPERSRSSAGMAALYRPSD